MIDIGRVRADTAGCDRQIHLNNAGASLVPKSVVQTITQYLQEEELNGGYETADRYQEAMEAFYTQTARLLNAQHHNIAYMSSATDAYNKALSAVAFNTGDVVLISENDYPSNYISFVSLQKRFGIRLVQVRNAASGEVDLNDLEEKLKLHQPKLVSISHVPTSSGLVQPVAEIGTLVRKYGAIYLLDACQSIGQMQVDAQLIQADFISGTFRKFLRGPRGAGLLYVSDWMLEQGYMPLFPDFKGAQLTSAHDYEIYGNAKRFEEWERSPAIVLGAAEAVRYLLDLGIQEVEARNQKLMQYLRKALSTIEHIKLQDRGAVTCNILTFSVKKGTAQEAKQYFSNLGINVLTTPKTSAMFDFEEKGVDWVVRVSPHYYNTIEELDVFVEAVMGFNSFNTLGI